MADPILRAIQTYGALQNIDNQNQTMKRQAALDETNSKNTASDRAWLDKTRGKQEEAWQREEVQRDYDAINTIVAQEYEAAGRDESKMDYARLAPEIAKHKNIPFKLQPLLDAEEFIQRKEASDELVSQGMSGKFNPQTALASFNLLERDSLEARGLKNKLQGFRLKSVVPDPEGAGLFFEAAFKDADGISGSAPLTVGAKRAGQGDDMVKRFSLKDELIPYAVAQQRALSGIGKYLESVGKIKKEDGKYVVVGSSGTGYRMVDQTNPANQVAVNLPRVEQKTQERSAAIEKRKEKDFTRSERLLQTEFSTLIPRGGVDTDGNPTKAIDTKDWNAVYGSLTQKQRDSYNEANEIAEEILSRSEISPAKAVRLSIREQEKRQNFRDGLEAYVGKPPAQKKIVLDRLRAEYGNSEEDQSTLEEFLVEASRLEKASRPTP